MGVEWVGRRKPSISGAQAPSFFDTSSYRFVDDDPRPPRASRRLWVSGKKKSSFRVWGALQTRDTSWGSSRYWFAERFSFAINRIAALSHRVVVVVDSSGRVPFKPRSWLSPRRPNCWRSVGASAFPRGFHAASREFSRNLSRIQPQRFFWGWGSSADGAMNWREMGGRDGNTKH